LKLEEYHKLANLNRRDTL